jgi:hypothetical protein
VALSVSTLGDLSSSNATIKDVLNAIVRKYAHKYFVAKNPALATPVKGAKGKKSAQTNAANEMVLDVPVTLSQREEQESDFFVFQLLSAIVELLVSYLGAL